MIWFIIFFMRKLFTIFFVIIMFCQGAFALSFQKKTQQEPKIDEISQQAKVMYVQNNIDQAYNILEKKPEDERTAEDWLMMGNIMQDKEEIDKAIYMFSQAVNVNPKYYKAHYNLGYIYLSKNQPNMALDEFKLAVRYKPDFFYGYYNMGCAYLKLGKYSTAKYNFFKALDLKANEPDVYYNIAYSYKMMGKEKQAQQYLDLYNKMIEQHNF